MMASDGFFSDVTEDAETIIVISSWVAGSYTLWIRGQDAAGNWGDAVSVVLVIIDDEGPALLAGKIESQESQNMSRKTWISWIVVGFRFEYSQIQRTPIRYL